MDPAPIVETLRRAIPDLQAIYVFGSHARGDAIVGSDLDLAVLCSGKLAPALRWDLAGQSASLAHRDVDLVDLRSASTVLQVNVLEDGRLLYEGAPYERALFEAAACADYTRLQEERRPILEQIAKNRRVYA